MKKIIFIQFILFTSFSIWIACNSKTSEKKESIHTEQDEYAELSKKAKSVFGILPDIIQHDSFEDTREKFELGKKLYFDVRLSADQSISCNSCHNLKAGGVDGMPVSTGIKAQKGNRNAPTVFNAALHIAQFWDGRAADVEEQAGGPILNPKEMGMKSKSEVEQVISAIPEYKSLFALAFPKDKNPIKYANIQQAIGAFERHITTPSALDRYLNGDNNALNAEEKKGLSTFMEVGCNSCHNGITLGGNMFQKFGITAPYATLTHSKMDDKGRFNVTKKTEDTYVFKVPSLRNIHETGPYFHDGSVADLGEAIRIMGKLQLNKDLSQEQIDQIKTFLKTSSGKPQTSLIANPFKQSNSN